MAQPITMKYDFTTIINRKGKDSIAVDGVGHMPGFAPAASDTNIDVIPMWIADMFFPTAPSVTKAISERIKHPVFGYFLPPEEYYDLIIRWQKRQHGVQNLALLVVIILFITAGFGIVWKKNPLFLITMT